MKTDELIELLGQDATVRARFGSVMWLAAGAAVLAAGALFHTLLPMRADLAAVADTPRLLLKFGTGLALAAVAFGLARAIGRPGGSSWMWKAALAIPAVFVGAGIAAEALVSPADSWTARLIGRNAVGCLLFVPLLSVGPLALLLAAMRKSAPDDPGFAGAAAGLCASGIGITFYALHCTDDSPFFVAAWYGLATLVMTGIGYLAGTRLLRW